MTAPAGSRPPSAPQHPVSIVLVHGAFVDASGWQAVHDLLVEDGYDVRVSQHSTASLASDVATVERVIDAADHPVLLVGHSYGGMVITEAGMHAKVRSLAYIAAFVPEVGESVAAMSEAPVPPGESVAPVLPPRDGYITVDPEQFPLAFAADVPVSTTRFMAAAQLPWGLEALQARTARVAWKWKPSSYMVATDDRMIPPSAQRAMARRSGARTVEVKSSHAVMLSHPADVAAFIADAVDVTPAQSE